MAFRSFASKLLRNPSKLLSTEKISFSFRRHKSSLTSLSYSHGASTVPLRGFTINESLEKATEEFPSRDAFVFTKAQRRFTFEELLKKVLVY